ncbi:Uu.00g143340.m01.CDS01 [Anthostomella pinea]|uniref:Uu.00g143340.m01.CDS01 n=1 Tax=Anthostomella pinea TaxID=933095 RepID=A0AAI8VQM8_9PEZI|nr:Uu.00g143340.m01.CDS01 [Anthostomella pinea]
MQCITLTLVLLSTACITTASASLLPSSLALPSTPSNTYTQTTASSLTTPLNPVQTLLGSLGNAPPPTILWTPHPSPECAAINGGTLQCCRGSLAGDQPPVVFLASVYGYALNPNDVNGVGCDDNLHACPGVKLCCQVTALNPLLSLYCQGF